MQQAARPASTRFYHGLLCGVLLCWICAPVIAFWLAQLSRLLPGPCISQFNQARTQVLELEKALDIYRVVTGHYPSQAQGLQPLLGDDETRPFFEALPRDPWGNEYQYLNISALQGDKPVIFSAGPDGRVFTEDDVYSFGDLDQARAAGQDTKVARLEALLYRVSK